MFDVVKFVAPALSYNICNPVVKKSCAFPIGCLYSTFIESVWYGLVTLCH